MGAPEREKSRKNNQKTDSKVMPIHNHQRQNLLTGKKGMMGIEKQQGERKRGARQQGDGSGGGSKKKRRKGRKRNKPTI